MKFLQLNLYKGKFIDTVIAWIKEQDYDVVQLQEVSGDFLSFDFVDCFKKIQEETALHGELVISWNHEGQKEAYFGNATFFKKNILLKDRKSITLEPYQQIHYPNLPVEHHPRSALSLLLSYNGRDVRFINTHQAWGPTPLDTPYKMRQAEIIYEHIKDLKEPFVLSGDFNMTPETEAIKLIDSLGKNLTVQSGITNTLDPRAHRAKHLFPNGLAVDFIIVHPEIEATNASLLEKPLLSDHFGLSFELL